MYMCFFVHLVERIYSNVQLAGHLPLYVYVQLDHIGTDNGSTYVNVCVETSVAVFHLLLLYVFLKLKNSKLFCKNTYFRLLICFVLY